MDIYLTTSELAELEKTQTQIPGQLQHILYKDVQWQDEYGAKGWDRVIASKRDGAEVVSSEITSEEHYGVVLFKGTHAPVLDIDMPAYLIPSSTPGHSHLYIDHPMSWRAYKQLLKALAKAGILEKGYVKASIRRKHTAVRVPWRQKNV